MVDTASWGWVVTSTWPGYSGANQNNLGPGGNGLSVDPSTYTDVTLHDHDNEGSIWDTDTDDASALNGDRIIIGGTPKILKEIACYANSSITVDGTTYSNISMGVFLFEDGTYMVRPVDWSIPVGEHHKKVTAINLGSFNGSDYSALLLTSADAPFICFAGDTPIDTATGPQRAEALRPGARIPTRDHGVQTVRWTGQRVVDGRGRNAPILFRPGAMGNTRPVRLSPHHRVLVTGWRAELYFGAAEVLVPAHMLVNGVDILRAPVAQLRYVHLLFDRHEIIGAAGLLSESFHPGAYGMGLMHAATRAEVLALFPELETDPRGYGPTARPCLKAWEARLLQSA
ncbi:Hint domain-containing protein [Phaeovulum vinaykumarii]|uniref:Hint domain-containing protein n=1 Tax=Phaeovulum vinaykumarii TaxID=407234 RepID=A0A1N7MFL4_9RHOB|nr:Hint domain-containing protein [Phaeovulum vinaykumarii]SIS84857.1 Hint domain-containing protein [Phaeovulum vinaykumarii]SOC11975.1 Hint domain-containing protein [Phaeovulum vinaykumarii]